MARSRTTLFIGSSTEGLKIAKALQLELDPVCEVTIWNQKTVLSQGTLESLVSAVDDYDFAALVLSADDLILTKGNSSAAPRDNVLFELGLFMGSLGRGRTFIVYDRTADLKLPTDLAGVTAATYEPHASGNLRSSVGAAATRIEEQLEHLGRRERRRLEELQAAAAILDSATEQMQKLVRLIARSRKVELDVIVGQFGNVIAPNKLSQIRQDLADLEATLEK